VCRALRKGKRRKNCKACLPPLKEQNIDAVRMYLLTRNQLILTGMGDPVDINHMPIHEAMRLYRVKNPRECFEKVLTLANNMMERAEAERERKEGKDGLEGL
jgi:hypothetical protein